MLFDLGGVLADLGDPVAAMGLDMSSEEFWTIWLASSQVHAFEIGALAAKEFFPGMADEFGLADREGFENRFATWRLGLFAGAEAFLQSVTQYYDLALLSNTNEVHWKQIATSTQVFSGFAQTFLSFETGHYKPSTESYDQVIAHFDCSPQDVVFIDDSPRNVLAARQMRFNAHQARGIQQAKVIVADDLAKSEPGVQPGW